MSNMYVIAEVGSNWKTLDDCLYSVRMAKHCGADAIKFQYFTPMEMYGFEYSRPVQQPNLEAIKAECDAVNIHFLCTAFSVDSLLYVNRFVSAHKIASSDMCYVDLLVAASTTNKTVYLSTGGHELDEIQRAMAIVGPRCIPMYCESAYPAYCTDPLKFHAFINLADKVGISDHSKEIFSIPLMAQSAGFVAIEKHVDFCDIDDAPDHEHSLSGDDFKRMVDALKGGFRTFLSPEEADMVTRHNRRIVATKEIAAGSEFKEGYNIGCYRSTYDCAHALSPFAMPEVNGKIAVTTIAQGQCITEDLIR